MYQRECDFLLHSPTAGGRPQKYLQLLQQLLQAQTTSLPVTIPMKSVLPAFLSVILTARASVLSGNSKILLKICESGGIL